MSTTAVDASVVWTFLGAGWSINFSSDVNLESAFGFPLLLYIIYYNICIITVTCILSKIIINIRIWFLRSRRKIRKSQLYRGCNLWHGDQAGTTNLYSDRPCFWRDVLLADWKLNGRKLQETGRIRFCLLWFNRWFATLACSCQRWIMDHEW